MRTTFLFSILIFLAACSKKNVTGNSSGNKNILHVSLTAENLSEDVSKLSTQNDEIVLLAYAVNNNDSAQAPPILCEYAIFDSLQMKYDFISDSIVSSFKGDLAFVLVEMDDDEVKEQVEIVVTPNLSKISKAFKDNDAATLTNYLGDNDLLGITFVGNSKKQKPIVISGVHMLDSYKYVLTFKQ